MPYDGSVILSVTILSPVVWAFILFFIYRFMARIESRRNRFIFPVVVILIPSVIGALFTLVLNRDIISFILNFPLPTLAIFTLLPVMETVVEWRNKGRIIAVLSFLYSFFYFWYYWGSYAGGVDQIFLTISSPMPTDSLQLSTLIIVLYNYAGLVLIAGLIVAVPGIMGYVYLQWKKQDDTTHKESS